MRYTIDMITTEAATLADALAAIRELKTLVQKQTEEILNLKAALADARALYFGLLPPCYLVFQKKLRFF